MKDNGTSNAVYLDREHADKQRIAELESQVEALTKERDYWKSTTDDPGLYWSDDNPPYRLWTEDADGN